MSNLGRLARCTTTAVRVWAAVVALTEDGEPRTTAEVMKRTGLSRRSVEIGRAELQRVGLLRRLSRDEANQIREDRALGIEDPRRVQFRARPNADRQAHADEARRQLREAGSRGDAHQLAVILEYVRHIDGKPATRGTARLLAEILESYGADACLVGVIVMADFDHATGSELMRWRLARQFAARYVWENAD